MIEYFYLAAGVVGLAAALMGLGALIYWKGVQTGLRMSRMAWNAVEGRDPLDKPSERTMAIEDIPHETV